MPEDHSLVSIVISAYNSEKTLDKAITSALNQTYKSLEIIIVNDCSTDKTLAIAESYMSDKIRVIDNSKNSGTYFCFNYAISVAKGKYITFLGADDWIDENHIESLHSTYLQLKDKDYWSGTNLESNKNSLKIISCTYNEYLDGKKVERHPGNIKTIKHGLFNNMLASNSALATMFFEKKLIREVGYFDSVRFSADMEFFKRVSQIYGPQPYWLPIDRATYNYNRVKDSLTKSPKTSLKSEARTAYEDAYKKWHKMCEFISAKPFITFESFKARPFKVEDPNKIILSGNDSTSSFVEILKTPKISIVMQSFLEDYPFARTDPERKFIRAVYSIISQTYKNWELIIISDGCNITQKLYEEYFSNYENIIFKKIDKPTGTEMYASGENSTNFRGTPRRAGVELASGDWICYLDGDDIFRENAISLISEEVKNADSLGLKYLLNKTRIEHSSFSYPSNIACEVGRSFCINGIPSRWKEISLKGSSIIKSTSSLIHKKGFPSHEWGDTDGSAGSEDNIYIDKILSHKDSAKHIRLISLPYYVRCHMKKGWDH